VAGRPVAELDLAVAELVARIRSDARYQETLAGLGDRAAAGAPAGVASGQSGQPTTGCFDPCADVAGTVLTLPSVADPAALISPDYVTAAGVLAVVYQYGDRIGFFAAVDRAIEQLDGDELCLGDEVPVQTRLYCYHERDDRVPTAERARLAATVLGLRDPRLPAGVQPDPIIPGLLDELLAAIDDNCDPGPFRDEPTSTDLYRLESAARAVHTRLSTSVTGLSALRIRDLQRQFETARSILAELAPFVRPLCRPGAPVPAQGSVAGLGDEWVAVAGLLGAKLPDGTTLFDAAATASAWRTVFDWLIDSVDPLQPVAELTADVCEAAATLRPYGRGRGRCRCGDHGH
jgi:hypothetical protein